MVGYTLVKPIHAPIQGCMPEGVAAEELQCGPRRYLVLEQRVEQAEKLGSEEQGQPELQLRVVQVASAPAGEGP